MGLSRCIGACAAPSCSLVHPPISMLGHRAGMQLHAFHCETIGMWSTQPSGGDDLATDIWPYAPLCSWLLLPSLHVGRSHGRPMASFIREIWPLSFFALQRIPK